LALRARKPLRAAYPKTLDTLGNHLRKKRLDLGLRQKDVAKLLGADETSVYNWERNANDATLRFSAKIIKFLGYCPWDFKPRSFGEWVILSRRLMSLSQKKLARRLGVDPGTLSNWERDRAMPPEKIGRKLIALFRQAGGLPMEQTGHRFSTTAEKR
jgi:DNA-binding XRE family transcriptional regulator